MSMLIDVECEMCRKPLQRRPFEIKINKHQFCSRDCYHEWRKGKSLYKPQRIPVICNGCGCVMSLAPSQAKRLYCSKECRTRHVTAAVVCAECGKEFKRTRSSQGPRNFCCRTCHHSWRRKNEGGVTHPAYKSKVVPCDHCGSPLEREPKRIENNKYHFCNHDCYSAWMSTNKTGENAFHWTGGKIEVVCAHCDKPLKRIRYDVETTERFFCNKKCLAAWMSANIVGESHPNWKGGWWPNYGPNWKTQRAKARKRDGYKCQHCGITQKKLGKELDVHHIVPFREFGYVRGENENHKQANQLSNLTTLCPSCHHRAEWGKIPLRLPLF